MLGLGMAAGTLAVRAAEVDAKALKAQAQACADAMLHNDFKAIVGFTHPKIINGVGGKDAMAERLRTSTAEMQKQGAVVESATIGTPFNLQVMRDGTQTGEVPQRIVLKVSGGHLSKDSYLLGVKLPGAGAWVYIDMGKMSMAQFVQSFPEYGDCIELRPQKDPVFTPDK